MTLIGKRLPPCLRALLCVALPCLALLGLVVPGLAQAADAEIEVLSHTDRSGRWRMVDNSDQGSLWRGETEDLLRKDAVLAEGDRIVTRSARVQLLLSDGSRLNVAEDTELTLLAAGEGDTWARLSQRAGEVYHRMKNALAVEHGTVETVVEGTRFIVAGPADGPVVVQVEEGVVTVSRDGGEAVRLKRGRQLSVPRAGELAQAAKWRPKTADFARSWPLGRARLQVGALASGQLLAGAAFGGSPDAGDSELGGGLRLFAGLHLPRDLRLTASTGLGAVDSGSLRVPVGVGLAWQPGDLTLGGELNSTLEDRRLLCGEQYTAVHVGGAGYARLGLTLSRRLQLLGEVRAGYADGFSVQPAVGVGVGL